jgi:hypothetical protein
MHSGLGCKSKRKCWSLGGFRARSTRRLRLARFVSTVTNSATLGAHDAVGRGRLSGSFEPGRVPLQPRPRSTRFAPQIRGSHEQAHRAVAQARSFRSALPECRSAGYSSQPDAGCGANGADREGRGRPGGSVMTKPDPSVVEAPQPTVIAEAVDASSGTDESQEVLTRSVGQRLTRESHDTQRPRWRRWLGRR